MVKLLLAEKVFEKTLGCRLGDNGKTTNTDLFQKRMAALAGSILLQNYICQVQKNWKQALQDDRKIEQDLFDKNLNNIVEHRSIYDDNKE